MKLSLSELESLFCDIQDIIDYVEMSNFEGRRFSMFLSNGDKINYKLFKDHVPHLLGININALIATGLFKKQSTFEVLKDVVSNPYRIHKMFQEGIIDYKNIFSDFIYDKIKVFKANISPNIYEMEFVCKYNSKRCYNLSDKNAKYDYIFVKKIRDTENYAVLCLVDNGTYYGAMSSMYFDDKEKMQDYLKEYIENQEITLFNGVRVVGDNGEYERKYNLKPETMVFKLEELLNYKDSFSAIVETTDAYIYSLKETLKHMDKHFDDNSLIYDLIKHINEGVLVDRDKYIFSGLINIVDSYNNLLSKGFNTVQISESYSEMQISLKSIKEELTKIRNELELVKLERDKYVDLSKSLEEENREYKIREEGIMKILKPSN